MTTSHSRITATLLTYAGTLPLLVAAIAAVGGTAMGTDHRHGAITYGAIIISFLAGIHWGAAVLIEDEKPRTLFVTSNIIALLAWLSLLISPRPALCIEILCFLMMLAIDVILVKDGILPRWFFTLRRNATLIVVACLTVIAGTI